MANQDAPFGFRAVGGMGSSYETQGTSKYQINDNYSSSIFQGDVVMTGDGGNDAESTATVAGYIAPAAAGDNNNVGIFNGCFYNDPTTQKPTWKNYYPTDTNITTGKIDAFVYDNPQQLFETQTSGTLTQSDAGNLGDMGTYVAGSTINGRSKEELTDASISNTATFRIIRLSEDPSNSDTSSANSNWIVRFNESIYYDRAVKTA
jgi:hypothetical protein